MALPEIGRPAPDFSGPTQDGSIVSLASLRGQRVALYFYPRDNTSGCTKQACSLRDHYEGLQEARIRIVGVSDDPVESHDRFAAQFNLPFPLIADTDHTVLDAYGMWGEKSMYGRKYMGTQRSTFLIDEEGVLRAVILNPKVGQHAEEILEAFSKL